MNSGEVAPETPLPKKQNKLTLWILFALVLGLIVGYGVYRSSSDPQPFIEVMALITSCFMRLIKMIIAPLIFTTLVVGIAKMGDAKAVGRIGVKVCAWFLGASLISLLLGMVLVNIFRPGDSLVNQLPANASNLAVSGTSMSMQDFITHLIPTSIFDAMAKNEILQIVVFSVFFGIAAASMHERVKGLVDGLEKTAEIIMLVTRYVMNVAPLAVFAAVAASIARCGPSVLSTYGLFMSEFYFGILILWLILAFAGWLILRRRIFDLIKGLHDPMLLAFTTASSEAAYPKTLEALVKFGVQGRISSFVLPLGYSFNLDGSMMYCTFATLFIAQAYVIEMSLGQQMLMLLMLMVTSKGMAGVPRASLVVIAATLAQFNIPEAGLWLLLGVDHFLDMARSATNVLGNSIATAVIAKWEGALGPSQSPSEPKP